jgi:putative ABC transport system permease protein
MNDLRYACRQLLRNPGFTAVAVLTLALGIGANTLVFSVVNAALFRPLPYATPEQLVLVAEHNVTRGVGPMIARPANFLDWREQSSAFSAMAAEVYESFNVSGSGAPEHAHAARVTANYFDVLGVKPRLGRTFAPGEDELGRHRVVVLSHDFWQRQFGGDPTVVGRTIRLSGDPNLIVGVMPEGFRSFNPTGVYGRPTGTAEPALWVPYPFTAEERQNRSFPFLLVLGRLKPGLTPAQAQGEMDTVARRLEQAHETQRGWGATVLPLHQELVGRSRPALFTLLGAVGFVLLIACANVANLLLVRGAARRKEFAIRAALGAGWRQTLRQLLVESLLLTGLGTVAGVLVAGWTRPFIAGLGPTTMIRLEEVRIDGSVLAFAALISALAAASYGLVPLLQSRRQSLAESLQDGGRGGGSGARAGWLRSALVVAQVALALVLLIGAGLMIRSFRALAALDPGFRPEKVLALDFTLPDPQYTDESRRLALIEQLLARVEALPGVKSAATVYGLPFSTMLNATSAINLPGRPVPPGERIVVGHRQASSRYFETLGISLVNGRAFTDADRAGSPPVVIINESLARVHFPQGNPVGQRIALGANGTNWCEIVGVVRDVKLTNLEAVARPEVYQPHRQSALWMFSVVVRTDPEPAGVIAAVRAQALALDGDLPAANVRTLEQDVARSLGPRRLALWLLGLFSLIALVLAVAGIYGVMSFVVSQRTRELGVRMALGASKGDVLKMILSQGARLAAFGLGLGAVGVFALQRVIAGQLYAVSVTDPVTLAGLSLLLFCAALLACLVPAWRATQVDPMAALKSE